VAAFGEAGSQDAGRQPGPPGLWAAADPVGSRPRVSDGGPHEGSGAGAGAGDARSLCARRANRAAARPTLRARESSPRRPAHGPCRTCGTRPERVSHEVLGKPTERVFHRAHRPSFFSISEETNQEGTGNPINGAMIQRSVTLSNGLTGIARPCRVRHRAPGKARHCGPRHRLPR